MPIYQVLVLAVIQGLTEFLPVSSTAHLDVAHWLFNWHLPENQDFAFDIALHAGTVLAVIIYFFRDWIQIIAQAFGIQYTPDRQLAQNRGLLWLLAIGSIPVGVAGLFFEKQAESSWRSPYIVGAMLIVVGVVMWLGERAGKLSKDLSQIGPGDAALVGLAQAVSIIPGTSRSGITITAGLFRDITRESAAKFSFLLLTPAVTAAVLKKSYDLHKTGLPHEMVVPCIVGAVVSGIVGAVVIKFLLDFLRRHGLAFFIYYRVIFGIIVIALATFFRFSGE